MMKYAIGWKDTGKNGRRFWYTGINGYLWGIKQRAKTWKTLRGAENFRIKGGRALQIATSVFEIEE